MERDFLGLNSKESVIVVKEEAVEVCKDSAFYKGSAIQWPLSSKISALPHFMSFAQQQKSSKIMPDPLVTSRSVAASTADTFDPSNRCQVGEIQKNTNHGRQGGTHFITAYAVQQNAHSVMFAGSNQTVPITMSNPFFKTDYAGAAQTFTGAPMKQQLLGGVPVIVPHSILPSIGSFAGTTELFNSKASHAPAQLTIFYGGAVNVFDDISPEKAHAIMLLAGNGSVAASNSAQPRAQVQAPSSKVAAGDVAYVNQPMNAAPCSGISSPMSVSSHPVGQSGDAPTNMDETGKTIRGSVTPVSKASPPKVVTSLGSVTVTTMMPSAVPQARKASLARFLEKRKERAMNAAPYNLSKQSLNVMPTQDPMKESSHDI